jgi:flagella basal body P-ring formation protein FlgA
MRIHVRHPKHTDWLGPVSFSVSFSVRGHLVKKISVPATIEVWSDVIVAAKPLGRNQPVSPGSIKVVRMNLSRAPANAILSKEQVVGMRVNRSIAANSILRSDQIEIPPVVKRGDLVQVLAQSKGMKISVKGVAKQNGGVGERIRVQNMRSKRIIYAQVLDDQTVQVDF